MARRFTRKTLESAKNGFSRLPPDAHALKSTSATLAIAVAAGWPSPVRPAGEYRKVAEVHQGLSAMADSGGSASIR
jgi:hypothetical protein